MLSHPHRRLLPLPFLLRLPRVQILRISLLLLLLQICTILPNTTFQPILTTITTTTLTTAIALAATSSLLSFSSILTRLASRILPPDAAFLSLYGRIVLILGPLATVFEAALVTYEVMKLARDAEKNMWRSEAAGGKNWKRAIIVGSVAMLGTATGLVVKLWHIQGSHFAVGVCVVLLLMALTAPDGNLLEASALCNYVGSILFIAGVETEHGGDEAKAFVLVYTLGLILFTVLRGPRFVKLLTVGYDAMRECDTVAGDGIVACVAVPVVTFRILLWAGGVRSGEYLPVLCREVHMVCVVVFYAIFVRG